MGCKGLATKRVCDYLNLYCPDMSGANCIHGWCADVKENEDKFRVVAPSRIYEMVDKHRILEGIPDSCMEEDQIWDSACRFKLVTGSSSLAAVICGQAVANVQIEA
eukprot:11121208-Karenia_brevis.AAC.1